MNKKLLIPISAALVALLVWRFAPRGEFRYAGTLEATEVDISSRLAGPLLEVIPREGDRVTNGTVIARLDGDDFRLAAEQAQGDYSRGIQLNKRGSLPVESLERLRYRRDETALRVAWCALSAPLDATVLRRYREPGEWVTPGQKIFTLADLRDLYAYVYVPAPVMEKLKLNQEVKGLLPFSNNRQVIGTITHIRNEAEFTPKNVQTRTERERLVFGIKVAFDNTDGGLKPGMSVELTF